MYINTHISQLQKRYTVSGRDFGIDRHTVRLVLETCPECLKRRSLVSQNGLDDLQCSHQYNGFRFPNSYSMVAHMPDLECIWFDSKGKSNLCLSLPVGSKQLSNQCLNNLCQPPPPPMNTNARPSFGQSCKI